MNPNEMTDPELNEALANRFWGKVDIRGEDECWEWKGGVMPANWKYGCSGKPNEIDTNFTGFTISDTIWAVDNPLFSLDEKPDWNTSMETEMETEMVTDNSWINDTLISIDEEPEWITAIKEKGGKKMRSLFVAFVVNSITEKVTELGYVVAEDSQAAERKAIKSASQMEDFDDLVFVVFRFGGNIPEKKDVQEVKIVE